jgi:hypothetical protein
VVLPLLLLIFTWVILTGANSEAWGWHDFDVRTYDELAEKNPLFRFYNKGLRLGEETAVTFTRLTYQFLAYGVPVVCCFLFFARPLRFGLALGAAMLAHGAYEAGVAHEHWEREEWGGYSRNAILFQGRSYFGVLQVKESARFEPDKKTIFEKQTSLMHGTTHHGLNYHIPAEFNRLATTYYHKNGPVGDVMKLAYQRFDRKPDKWNTYPEDACAPTLMLGSAAMPVPGLLNAPAAMLPAAISTWAEPPFATIGLGTGTMAGYGRPWQHVHFYEIDEQIRNFSLPPGGGNPFFLYLRDALRRSSQVHVLMGDARLRMAQPWVPRDKEKVPPWEIPWEERGGPDGFYRVMVVDAFSSDAIPVHLITREAIAMYFTKLRPDGVLCVHTSNRHVDLVSPVTDVAKSLGLKWRVGKDRYDRRGIHRKDTLMQEQAKLPSNRGRFGSEYVMLARDEKYLPPENTPAQYLANPRETPYLERPVLWWYTAPAPDNRVWTDDFSDLLSVFRWGFGSGGGD